MVTSLKRLSPSEKIVLSAAGRTDTGVHALGQVISFKTTSSIPTERYAIALNSNLPPDISVNWVEEVPDHFHARFSAKSRTYGYLLWTRATRSAIWSRYSLHIRLPLDIGAMRIATQYLVGVHNFAAYGKSGDVTQPTTREVKGLCIRRLTEDRVLVVISATGFLRSMVRNIMGMLLEVGKGDAYPSVAEDILKTESRRDNPYQPVAPHGLFLWQVKY